MAEMENFPSHCVCLTKGRDITPPNIHREQVVASREYGRKKVDKEAPWSIGFARSKGR